jgi:hypothetical protein
MFIYQRTKGDNLLFNPKTKKIDFDFKHEIDATHANNIRMYIVGRPCT